MRSGFTARFFIQSGVIVALLGPAQACGRFGYDPTPLADSASSSDDGDGSVVVAASGGRASGTGGTGGIGGPPGGTGGSRASGGSRESGGAGGAGNGTGGKGTGGGSGETDADAAASGTGGAFDAGCVPAPYYADADGDGAGDANDVVLACDPPPKRVLVAGDCDDTAAFVHPGAIEVCDLVDDDCDGAIDETGCPADSVGSVWNGTPYLLIKTGLTWADARAACEGANLRMVQIDSQAEEDHLWALGGGVTFWIGATDQAVEGEWVWTSGEKFWTGGLNGQSVGGAYQDWKAGTDPQDALSGEDCGTVYAPHLGLWADEPCDVNYPVVCEGGP